MKLQWNALKSLKCPQCSSDLTKNLLGYSCTQQCGFRIGKAKFDEIVAKSYQKKDTGFKTEEQSLEELNNLDTEVMGDGFLNIPPDEEHPYYDGR